MLCRYQLLGFQLVKLQYSVLCCRRFDYENPVVVEITTSGCEGQDNEVKFLEHVQAFVSVNATRRGEIISFLYHILVFYHIYTYLCQLLP